MGFKIVLASVILIIFFQGCVVPPCTQDNAFRFDKWGRPLKKHKKKDPPSMLIKRCPIENCKTRKIHCHGNEKYRGQSWWKKQNPDQGESQKIYMNN